MEVNHYYPYGALMGESQNTTTQPYKYNGKELDRSFGLDWYDYGARWMDGVGGRWSSIDPLCEKYYDVSPYAYCAGNPVNRIDPDGKNPIYDKNGVFLGTDNLGLQGYYYVMNAKDFKQGMSHMKVGNLAIMGDLPEDVTKKIDTHYSNLPKRPDYDGFVTIAEGVEWAKSHPYALMNPTPDNTLYINASKLDFGSLSTSNFSVVGAKEPQNLFNKSNIVESAINPTLFATVYALGRVNMILQNKDTRTVKIVNDSATDYDWNLGGGFIRIFFIINNNRLTGIDLNKHGFKVYYYGVGTLRK